MLPGIKLASGLSFERLRWWAGIGAWAVLDQALVSIANFAFNVLLARWLDPVEYGAFAAGYALLWMAWSVNRGLLVDPAMVFSSSKFRNDLQRYHSLLLVGHFVSSIGFVGVLGLIGVIAHAVTGGKASLPWFSLALAGPVIFLPTLLRGLCRARLQTSVAAVAAILYTLTMLAGALLAYRLMWLSAGSAFAILAVASAASGVWLILRFRLRPWGLAPGPDGLAGRIAREHWRYGRWLVGVGVLSWLPMNIWYAALPLLTGIEDAGRLRALMNLAQPAIQGYAVAHGLMIPMFVMARENRRFRQTLHLVLAGMLAAGIAFAVPVAVFARPIAGWLYGGRYTAEAGLIWPILLTTVIMGISIVQGAAMQSLERGDWLMASYGAAAAVILLVGLPATAIWGLSGAVFGQFCAILAVVVAQACWLRHPPRDPA